MVEGELDQLRLVLGRGHARQGPDLGPREPPLLHLGRGQGQVGKAPGRPQPLAGRAEGDPGPPVQPVGAGAPPAPEFLLVEAAQQRQKPVQGGVDVRGKLGDLVADGIAVRGSGGRGSGGRGGRGRDGSGRGGRGIGRVVHGVLIRISGSSGARTRGATRAGEAAPVAPPFHTPIFGKCSGSISTRSQRPRDVPAGTPAARVD